MADSSPLTVTPSTTSAINRQVLKVSPNAACSDVIQQMTGGSQGTRNSCAFIVDETETVIGIITERDIVSITAAQTDAKSFSKTPISAVMTTPVKTLEIEAFQDIFAVLFLFRRYRIRHLPIVDAQDRLIGVVTPASIRRVLKPANLLKMRRVADVMTTDVIQAPADVPVVFLAQLMAQHRVSCIVIVDTTVIEEDGEPAISPPVGIVTERDIVQFQALNLNLHKTTAATVMSTPLFLLDPQDSLWAAHQAMQTRKVRRLVVSWNWGRDIGIVTQTSLLRVFDPIEMCSIIDSLQQTANQLAAEAASKATTKTAISQPTTFTIETGTETQPEPESEPESEPKSEPEPKVQIEPSPEDSLPSLLSQASQLIEAATQNSQLNPFQRPQLQQAQQIIQHVRNTLPTGFN